MRGRQDGFTLTELLMACSVLAIVLTLGASSFLHYWKSRALAGSVDEVVTELRGEQQDASTQTHPWVAGAWFKQGTSEWGLLRADASAGTCQVTSRRTFPAGVTVSAVSFADVTTHDLSANCTLQAGTGAEVVLFYARGTATGGSVSLSHPGVAGGAARTIGVSPITGRVTRP